MAESPAPNVRIAVLSGPSGSGKSTVVNRLVADSPLPMIKAISATTRPPRVGEIDGKDYYFLSEEEFERKREQGEFVEYAEVFGSGFWYGTLKSELERAAKQGDWAFLEIDVQGAQRVIEQYPDTVSIFLKTASEPEFEQRLRQRGTETEDVIRRRLETARRELTSAERYRHIVINDDLDRAVQEISQILIEREAELNAR